MKPRYSTSCRRHSESSRYPLQMLSWRSLFWEVTQGSLLWQSYIHKHNTQTQYTLYHGQSTNIPLTVDRYAADSWIHACNVMVEVSAKCQQTYRPSIDQWSINAKTMAIIMLDRVSIDISAECRSTCWSSTSQYVGRQSADSVDRSRLIKCLKYTALNQNRE